MNDDSAARQAATEPDISCLVRAPAGSGKTTLLVRRYLRLLATVDKPEEVLCVTFTNKATAEMRDRILKPIRRADRLRQQGESASGEDEQMRLALAVLRQDDRHDWQLLRSPHRFNIRTLDGLCAQLVKAHPLAHALSGQHRILVSPDYRIHGNAEQHCSEVARTLVREPLDDRDRLAARGRQHLLSQCGGNADRLETTLAQMLQTRLDWMPLLLQTPERQAVQDGWGQITQHWSDSVAEAWNALTHSAGVGRPASGADWREPQLWSAWRSCLLTRQGKLRKRFNAGTDEEHRLIEQFLQRLHTGTGDAAEQEAPPENLLTGLHNALQDEAMSEQAQQFVHRLNIGRILAQENADFSWYQPVRAFLLRAMTRLTIDMAEQSAADYTAVAMAADIALGNEQHVTELALALDYRLRHLLVDEVQDLSPFQFQLLQKLVAGWQKGDGRTLMMVGDTAQSCYSFRGARPGEIARIADRRQFAQVQLDILELTRNFRSRPPLVAVVNKLFAEAFPAQAEFNQGAEPYLYMQTGRAEQQTPEPEIQTHLWRVQTGKKVHRREKLRARALMAHRGIAFVRQSLQALKDCPNEENQVGVLVRNRSELPPVVHQLQQAGICFSTDTTLRYSSSEAVRTLVALARTLRNPADRIAWLALLRSPLCGLSFGDLHALAADHRQYGDRPQTLWASVRSERRLSALSGDGRRRVRQLMAVLQQVQGDAAADTLLQRLRRSWYGFRGGEIFADQEVPVREAFVQIESWQELDDWSAAEDRFLNQTYIPGQAGGAGQAGERVRLMTIHAAKGLQFGAVLLPDMMGTGRRGSVRPAVQTEKWYEADQELVLIQQSGFAKDESGGFFTDLRRRREQLESVRLCYVAMTRAIHRLCLCGIQLYSGGKSASGGSLPAGSLLQSIGDTGFIRGQLQEMDWQDYEQRERQAGIAADQTDGTDRQAETQPTVRTWYADLPPPVAVSAPAPSVAVSAPAPALTDEQAVRPALSQLPDNRFRAQGTLVHLLLEAVIAQGADHWRSRLDRQPEALAALCRNQLRMHGVPRTQLQPATEVVLQCLQNALTDERHAWLFAAGADDSLSGGEVAIGYRSQAENLVRSYRMDLSLVDDKGTRWIVDYKVARRQQAESQQDFADRQLRMHGEQLDNYRRIVSRIEPQRPLRCALYFPAEQLLLEYLPDSRPQWAML